MIFRVFLDKTLNCIVRGINPLLYIAYFHEITPLSSIEFNLSSIEFS
jgi:hypothetical protein